MSSKRTRALALVSGAIVLCALAVIAGRPRFRRTPAVPTIAVIPQATGAMLWDVEHSGANAAAELLKVHLYWNAPTSENDVAGQVSLIDKVSGGKYQGLVLAPNHPRTVLAPLRRALESGFPVVVISDPLDVPATANLAYILNDNEKMGELAAAEIARLIHGEGSIAFAGLGRYAPGVMRRALGAERFLISRFPGIHIVNRLAGAYSVSRAEALTTSALESHPELRAILSFTAISTRGVHSSLKSRPVQDAIHLVGCEQDSDLIDYVVSGEIAAIAAENTYRMGYEAVELISASLAGKPLPPTSLIAPLLITKKNVNSPETSRFMTSPK